MNHKYDNQPLSPVLPHLPLFFSIISFFLTLPPSPPPPVHSYITHTYPFVVFHISSCKHRIVRSLGQLFIVVTIKILEALISHVECRRKFWWAEFCGDVRLFVVTLGLSLSPQFSEEVIRGFVFGKLIAFAQRHNDHYVMAVRKQQEFLTDWWPCFTKVMYFISLSSFYTFLSRFSCL